MFCPQCGQQQISNEARFCSRCGFALSVVAEVLAGGGQLMRREALAGTGERVLSPKQKGIRQGAMQMASSLLIVPLVSILSVFIFGGEEVLIPLAAIITFGGGLLRIIYSLLLESNAIPATPEMGAYLPPATPARAPMNAPARGTSLPPAQGTPVPIFAPRHVQTEELAVPPSVTENTTRLLDHERHAPPKE